MKKYYKTIKSKLVLVVCACLLASSLHAKYVGMVDAVSGTAFLSYEERISNLQPGVLINDFSELITEEGAQITFSDYDGHRFFLSGSGHMKILNRLIELKKGYLWIQSLNKKEAYSIQTVNANITFLAGEGVVSFDNYVGKTQLLSINGNFDISNLLTPNLATTVSDGKFSFVSADYEEGAPRNPTSIGNKSFQQIASLFDGFSSGPVSDHKQQIEKPLSTAAAKEVVAPAKKNKSRAPASLDDRTPNAKHPGETILVKRVSEKKINPDLDLDKYYAEKLHVLAQEKEKRTFKISYQKRSNVKLRVFGNTSLAPSPSTSTRITPAATSGRSPSSIPASPTSLSDFSSGPAAAMPATNDVFEQSLMNKYKQQMRHSSEKNGLIDDLRNYRQDFDKSY